ncbi:MAG: hypothetical protein IT422_20835 [Pirellulaceae bacterium]|nr:hypothetical protein [Pirellulaceae bacterium]
MDQLNVNNVNSPALAVEEMLLADDGQRATIRCVGPTAAGLGEQVIDLDRPHSLSIRRQASQPMKWWYSGDARRDGNALIWPDGTRLEVAIGHIVSIDPTGLVESKSHYGGMKYADPHPFTYPVVTVQAASGALEILVTTPDRK